VDPVSRVLERRERRSGRMLPWFLAALVLHAGVGLGIVLVARIEPPVRTFSPSVSVHLVRLPAPARRRPDRRSVPAAPTPAPTVAPAPTLAPTAPPARVEPQPERERGRPSERAMPEPTPGPTATPIPAATPSAGGMTSPSGGLSLGGAAGEEAGGPPALPSDFRFTYYVQRMLALIEAHWYKPPVPPGTRARVRFTILRSGAVRGIALEESSGIPSFDRAALRAMYAANPLPPLPPGYARESITVHLTFSENP